MTLPKFALQHSFIKHFRLRVHFNLILGCRFWQKNPFFFGFLCLVINKETCSITEIAFRKLLLTNCSTLIRSLVYETKRNAKHERNEKNKNTHTNDANYVFRFHHKYHQLILIHMQHGVISSGSLLQFKQNSLLYMENK